MRKRPGSGADLEAGISLDQIAAKEFGKETQLASLELALESYDLVGQCEDGYGCAYSATIAWRNAKTPLPMEADPRAVFERLFGVSDSTDRQSRLGQIRRDRSILDMVTGQLGDLERVLGPGDRTRLTEYVDSIRDVERRIQIAEQQSDRELPTIHQPAGVPESFEGVREDHVRLAGAVVADRPDARRHVPVWAGEERPDVSGDWGARVAPSDLASPETRPTIWRSWRRSTRIT